MTEQNIEAINRIKLKEIHFAWDYMKESESVLRGLKLYASLSTRKPHGKYGTVFCISRTHNEKLNIFNDGVTIEGFSRKNLIFINIIRKRRTGGAER